MLKNFFRLSLNDLRANRSLFFNSILALIILRSLDAIPWQALGLPDNSGGEIATQLLNFFLGLIVTVEIINNQQSLLSTRPKEKLLFSAPAFLIYSIYYTFISFIGLALFIIPGLLALLYFSLAPLIAVLSPEESPFKKSLRLVKKRPLLVLAMVLISLMLEVLPLVLMGISSWEIKLMGQLLMAVPLALASVIFIQSMVRLYHYLDKLESASN